MNSEDLGSLMTDEQKEEFRKLGEQFYGNIDMDKFRPIPTEECSNIYLNEHTPDTILYGRLLKAIDSGLLVEDFTEEELEMYRTLQKIKERKKECNPEL